VLWSALGRQWLEIATLAPLVAGARLSSAARVPHTRTQQRETVRMLSEKVEAAAESGTLLWSAAWYAHQLAWQRAWRAGRAVPLPEDYALAVTTARRLGRVGNPVSRRVSANAQRLAGGKRRR
jgi:hypothetical protein